MDNRKTVEILNCLISAAYLHGGDYGGPYGTEPDLIRGAIQDAIEYFGLNEYTIKTDKWLEDFEIVLKEK